MLVGREIACAEFLASLCNLNDQGPLCFHEGWSLSCGVHNTRLVRLKCGPTARSPGRVFLACPRNLQLYRQCQSRIKQSNARPANESAEQSCCWEFEDVMQIALEKQLGVNLVSTDLFGAATPPPARSRANSGNAPPPPALGGGRCFETVPRLFDPLRELGPAVATVRKRQSIADFAALFPQARCFPVMSLADAPLLFVLVMRS